MSRWRVTWHFWKLQVENSVQARPESPREALFVSTSVLRFSISTNRNAGDLETIRRRRAHCITDSVLAHGMAELLASAFSAVFHSTVVTYDEYCRDKEKNEWGSDTKLDKGQLFRLSYVSGPSSWRLSNS